MKKIILVLFGITFLISCEMGGGGSPDSSLSGLSDNFNNPTGLIGQKVVKVTSKTPASIAFRFRTIYVEDYEVTNAAQEHCQQYNRNAMLNSEEREEDNRLTKTMIFQCVE